MSGQTIGTFVGFAIGSFFGAPQIGAMIGGAIGGYLDPDIIKGPKLGDLPVQTAAEGTPRPIIYGAPQAFAGNVEQIGPPRRVRKRERQGKGGPVLETEEVYQTYAISFCESDGDVELLTLWRNDKVVFDRTGEYGLDSDSAVFASKMTWLAGGEDQMPHPALEALPPEYGGGAGTTVAYRGTAMMVVDNDNTTQFGGAIPQYKARVARNVTVTSTCGGQSFWFPLDDAQGAGGAREVIQNLDGVYGGTVSAGAQIGPSGSETSLHIASNNAGMVADYALNTFETTPLTGWTRMVWFNCLDTAGGSVMKNIATNWQDEATGLANWSFSLKDGVHNMTPRFVITYDGFGGTRTLVGEPVGINEPTHLAAKFVPDVPGVDLGTISFLQNGVVVDQLTSVTSTGLGANYITVGGMGLYASSYGYIGLVSDLMGFSVALSDSEIADFAFAGAGGDFWELPDAPGNFVDGQGNLLAYCAERATVDTTYLDAVLVDIASRVDVDDSELNLPVATSTTEVEGLLLGRQMAAADANRVLMGAYFADMPEYDGKVHWTFRGGATVADFTDDDWVDVDDDEETRSQQIELPRALELRFCESTAQHAVTMVRAQRKSVDISATGVVPTDLPMVFSRQRAVEIADKTLKCIWEEAQGQLTRYLPAYEHAYLTTADCFNYNGRRWRVVRIENLGATMKVEAVRDRVSNYESAATANVVQAPTPHTSSVKGPSLLQALNLPSLRAEDDKPGMYLGVTGLLTGWRGAAIYMSTDGGATESWVMNIYDSATSGRVTADITAGGTPLSVKVWGNETLESATSAQVTNGANHIAVTTGGVSEILSFEDVEGTEPLFDLSTLTRGRGGTTAASHADGDDFLLLDENLRFLRMDPLLAGRTIRFRAVTLGTPIENNDYIEVVFTPMFTSTPSIDFYETQLGEVLTAEDGDYLQLDI